MNLSNEEELPSIKELPDPFGLANGKRVVTRDGWKNRRKQIEEMLGYYQYGQLPPPPGNVGVQTSSGFNNNWGARQEHIVLSCGPREGLKFELDLLIPQGKTGPFPIILTGDAGTNPIPAEIVGRGIILAQFDRTQIAPDEASRTHGV